MKRIIFISREKDLFVTSVVKERYYFKNLSRPLTTLLETHCSQDFIKTINFFQGKTAQKGTSIF